jgi:hypothetical protein
MGGVRNFEYAVIIDPTDDFHQLIDFLLSFFCVAVALQNYRLQQSPNYLSK